MNRKTLLVCHSDAMFPEDPEFAQRVVQWIKSWRDTDDAKVVALSESLDHETLIAKTRVFDLSVECCTSRSESSDLLAMLRQLLPNYEGFEMVYIDSVCHRISEVRFSQSMNVPTVWLPAHCLGYVDCVLARLTRALRSDLNLSHEWVRVPRAPEFRRCHYFAHTSTTESSDEIQNSLRYYDALTSEQLEGISVVTTEIPMVILCAKEVVPFLPLVLTMPPMPKLGCSENFWSLGPTSSSNSMKYNCGIPGPSVTSTCSRIPSNLSIHSTGSTGKSPLQSDETRSVLSSSISERNCLFPLTESALAACESEKFSSNPSVGTSSNPPSAADSVRVYPPQRNHSPKPQRRHKIVRGPSIILPPGEKAMPLAKVGHMGGVLTHLK